MASALHGAVPLAGESGYRRLNAMSGSYREDVLASGEAGVRSHLLEHLRGFRVVADVVCEVADGSANWAGPLHRGLFQRTTQDLNEVLCGGANVAVL